MNLIEKLKQSNNIHEFKHSLEQLKNLINFLYCETHQENNIHIDYFNEKLEQAKYLLDNLELLKERD